LAEVEVAVKQPIMIELVVEQVLEVLEHLLVRLQDVIQQDLVH